MDPRLLSVKRQISNGIEPEIKLSTITRQGNGINYTSHGIRIIKYIYVNIEYEKMMINTQNCYHDITSTHVSINTYVD